MTNKRMINGDTFEDEFFTTLSIFDRLLWIGCITKLADDQGRFRDNVALIRSNLFPMDDIPLNEIEKAIQLFSIDGRILRYEKGGKKLIQIVNWWKHQKPRWASASNYPAPDGWVDRYRYHGEGNKIIESNWNSLGGFIDGYIADSIVCEDEDEYEDKNEDEGKSEEKIKRARATAKAQKSNNISDPDLEEITPFSRDEVNEERELATIYMNVTGNMGLPVKQTDRNALFEAMRDIHANKNSHTMEYLRPFFKAWCERGYSKVNIGWLDWAIAGEVQGIGIKDKKDPRSKGSPMQEKSATDRRLEKLRGG